MITTMNLTKTYGRGTQTEVKAVQDASISIPSGEFTIISGPSGSGKSTLLSLLGLLTTPTSGRIFYGDEEVSLYSEIWKTKLRRDKVGFIFQRFNLFPQLTAWENVALPLVCRDVSVGERMRRAREVLVRLDVGRRFGFRAAYLSGGEQQRVAVARALVTDPEVVLADEPTASVDDETAQHILSLLVELHGRGRTIVVVTNDVQLMRLGSSFIHVRDGVVQMGK